MPQSPNPLLQALFQRQPPTPQRPLDQTPLETTNPYLAKVRDFLGGLSGLQDPITQEADPSLPLAIGSILGTLGGTSLPKGLWSRTQRAFEHAPFKQAHPNKWLSTIQNAGSPEEAEFTGLGQWLRQKGNQPVGKDEAVGYLHDNPLQVGETLYGGPRPPEIGQLTQQIADKDNTLQQWMRSRPSNHDYTQDERFKSLYASVEADQAELDRLLAGQETHYGQYTLPGGRDYQERVLSWEGPFTRARRTNPHVTPDPQFTNHAFSVPNALGWSRSDIRDTPFGPLKYVDELQSDIHQKGAKEGYGALSPNEWTQIVSRNVIHGPWGQQADSEGLDRINTLLTNFREGRANKNFIASEFNRMGVPYDVFPEQTIRQPNTPFKSNEWANLLLKRELVDAADNDLAGIALSPGHVQSSRWQGHGNSELYDRVLPKQLEKLVKSLGGQVETVGSVVHHSGNPPYFAGSQPAWLTPERADVSPILGTRLTPQMKQLINEKGFYALSPLVAALLTSRQPSTPTPPAPMASR